MLKVTMGTEAVCILDSNYGLRSVKEPQDYDDILPFPLYSYLLFGVLYTVLIVHCKAGAVLLKEKTFSMYRTILNFS